MLTILIQYVDYLKIFPNNSDGRRGNKFQPKFGRLRIFNASMGVLHLLQSTLMFLLSNDFSLSVTNTYPTGPQAVKKR